eukprot:1983534-Rhodomonas_salina.3
MSARCDGSSLRCRGCARALLYAVSGKWQPLNVAGAAVMLNHHASALARFFSTLEPAGAALIPHFLRLELESLLPHSLLPPLHLAQLVQPRLLLEPGEQH